jgi:hypothetical protein
MSAISQIVILLFVIINSFTQSTFSSVLLTDGCSKHMTYTTWKITQNLCPSHYLLSKSYVHHFSSFSSTFLQFNLKLHTNILLFQVCHFLGMPKSLKEQHTLVLKYFLKNHASYGLIVQTLLCLHSNRSSCYQQ